MAGRWDFRYLFSGKVVKHPRYSMISNLHYNITVKSSMTNDLDIPPYKIPSYLHLSELGTDRFNYLNNVQWKGSNNK